MKKGSILYWSVEDFNQTTTTTDDLKALGFERFVPRNDFGTAMLKAVRAFVKGEEKLYRRAKVGKFVVFTVFTESVGENGHTLRKEITIKVDTEHGNATFEPEVIPEIKRDYEKGKLTLSSDQFRKVILDYVEDIGGVKMRPGGGIYFLDQRLEPSMPRLRSLFKHFQGDGKVRLYEVPIHDDQDSLIAIEDAVSDKVFGEIEDIINEVEKKFSSSEPVTRKLIENRHTDAQKILQKIRMHEQNLRSKAAEVKERLSKVEAGLSQMLAKSADIVDPGEFSGLLRGL